MQANLKSISSDKPKSKIFKLSNLRFSNIARSFKDMLSRLSAAPEFPSFEAALAVSAHKAYEEDELLEVIRYKTRRYVDELNKGNMMLWESISYSIIGLMNPIACADSQPVRVLDFGGACGSHYFQTRKLLDKRVKLHWVVVETPGMVKIAQEFSSEELAFTSTISDAVTLLGQVDVIHSSGTLHFVPKPWDYLHELLATNPKYIILNRLGFYAGGKDVISIHKSKLSWNGIGPLPPGIKDKRIAYPACFLDKHKLENILLQNYTILAKFVETSGTFRVAEKVMEGGGYIFERNK